MADQKAGVCPICNFCGCDCGVHNKKYSDLSAQFWAKERQVQKLQRDMEELRRKMDDVANVLFHRRQEKSRATLQELEKQQKLEWTEDRQFRIDFLSRSLIVRKKSDCEEEV